MDIFAGNLSFESTEGDVKKLFEGFGFVASVVIVMEKEKKAPKSRGFGFVQMPDEQQALAAIAALNGKEFMGRVLDVDPARPKAEAQAVVELKEKRQPKVTVAAKQHPLSNKHLALKDRQHLALSDGKCATLWRVRPSGRPGTRKVGRRTHSYLKRRGSAGIQEEVLPRPRSQDNPMRWRKKKDQTKPWQKSPGEHKPWKKTKEEARPWKKAEGEPKPWKKPSADATPWSKSSKRPQKSGFNPSTSLGMVRGNGERSQTKDRKKPGGYKR